MTFTNLSPTGGPATYMIVRHYADDRPNEILVRGLTEEQAKAHCNRDDTHGDGWFDGYTVTREQV